MEWDKERERVNHLEDEVNAKNEELERRKKYCKKYEEKSLYLAKKLEEFKGLKENVVVKRRATKTKNGLTVTMSDTPPLVV